MSCLWEILRAWCSYVRFTWEIERSRSFFSEKDILILNSESIWKSITEYIDESMRSDLRVKSLNELKNWYWNEQESDVVFCICLILHDSRDSKSFYILLFIENLTRFYTLEISSISHSIEIETSKEFYKKRQLQKFEELLRIHTQIRRALICISRNSSASKRLRNIKLILQQLNDINDHAETWKYYENTHSNRICIDLNISKLFCIQTISRAWSKNSTSRSFLQQLNRIIVQTRDEKLWEISIQIRFAFVFASSHSSFTKDLVHASKWLRNFHTNWNWKAEKSTEDIRTYQAYIDSHISILFAQTLLRESQHQVDSTAIERDRQSWKSLKKWWRYTINSSTHLFERLATLLHQNDYRDRSRDSH